MTKLKLMIITGGVILFACVIFALIYNDMLSFNNPKYYKTAAQQYQEQDYSNAYYNFGKVKRISPLYTAALFKQALCAERLLDYKSAMKCNKKLVDKFPKSIFTPKARYNLAKDYYYLKDYKAAEKEFEYIQKHGLVENYAIAADYYLGLILKETDKNAAKIHFLKYLANSPNGTYSLYAANELLFLDELTTTYEKFFIARTYYEHEKYKEAREIFEGADINRSWPYLSILYTRQGLYPKAKAVFENGMKKYSHSVKQHILEDSIDNFVKIKNKEAKNSLFYLSKFVQENKTAGEDYVLYRLSKELDVENSIKLNKKVFNKYPNSKYAPECLWNAFWYEYQNGNLKAAKKMGLEHIKKYPDSKLNPKMLFWLGKLCIAQNKTVESNGYLNKLTTKYPDDYYAYRATAILKGKPTEWRTKSLHKLEEENVYLEFPINYSTIDIKDLKLINTIFSLGDKEIWNEINVNNKIVESWFEYKKGNKAHSALLAREGLQELDVKPPFNDDAYKLAYPIYWAADINKNSLKYELDPYLVISLIREESYFNENAKSAVGAIGLMQMIPSTASFISDKYSLDKVASYELLDPETNIQYGCAYLSYIDAVIHRNSVMLIAAYNGGPNAVLHWSNKIQYKDLDEFVEKIPYPETQNYIKKVYRSYWNYLNIYNY